MVCRANDGWYSGSDSWAKNLDGKASVLGWDHPLNDLP
jgi:hypothetical protein